MTKQDFSLPEGTHTVVLGAGDMNGIMRGKRIPASHWENVCKGGNAFSIALLVMDMTCDVWDTPIANFDNGYPDMHMFPLTKPVSIPWEPGVAMCMARCEGMDHKPVPVDPRNALVRQVERAAKMGYEINIGAELEFYLLDPETGLPLDNDIQLYSLSRASELEHVLGPIRREINEMGIPIEQSNPEYAPGQVEVNMRYGEALLTADRVVMFRTLIKQIAQKHGYLATFMAKPFYEHSGSGFHTHHSVWSEGKNIFAKDGKLNDTGRHYLGGMQKRMAESSLAASSNVNAYRRRLPYTFCPVNTTWGYDNRTLGLRVIQGSDSAVRIEKRDASADTNPYNLFAVEIAAGLDGIEQKIEPSAVTPGNGYEVKDAEPLPVNLLQAVEASQRSSFMRDILGDSAFSVLLQQAERELEFIEQQVTPIETERYLRNF